MSVHKAPTCLRCGECCRHLVNEVEGWGVVNGLLLLEHEKSLFPASLVRPQWGVSLEGEKQPRETITYQLSAMRCRHLSADGCGVHEERPLMCRAFPLVVASWDPPSISLSARCTFVKESAPDGRINGLVDRFVSSLEYRAASALANILRIQARTVPADIYWNYDLKTESWVRFPHPIDRAYDVTPIR